MTELVELLREAADLKRQRSELKQRLTSLKQEEDELLRKSRDIIDNSGLESVKFSTAEGSSMIAYRTTTIRASVTDPEEFTNWCEGSNLNVRDFNIFSPQKLTSFVRESIEDEKNLPEGIKVAEFEEVRIRKS